MGHSGCCGGGKWRCSATLTVGTCRSWSQTSTTSLIVTTTTWCFHQRLSSAARRLGSSTVPMAALRPPFALYNLRSRVRSLPRRQPKGPDYEPELPTGSFNITHAMRLARAGITDMSESNRQREQRLHRLRVTREAETARPEAVETAEMIRAVSRGRCQCDRRTIA